MVSRRVVVLHNFYRSENASGENLSVLDEVDGLRELDWDVEFVSADSDVIADGGVPLHELALRPIRSGPSIARVEDTLRRFRPHVALVENLFPLHSPWVIRTLRSAGVPVAAGVRSYRMFCAKANLYRDGRVCRDCVGSVANVPAIRHGCFQDSTANTVPMAISLRVHRGTFRSIDRLLPVSEHVADELVGAGFDRSRITVRPNFVADPGRREVTDGDGYLFAGRLTDEKGVEVLLEAWRRSGMGRGDVLRVVGSGPLAGLVDEYAADGVESLGLVDHERALELIEASAVTVVPSLWPEPFGRGVIEAAARSRPSLVSAVGGVGDLVDDGVTGWVAAPDVESWSDGLRRAADPAARRRLGDAARDRFEQRYTREVSLGVLDGALDDLRRRR